MNPGNAPSAKVQRYIEDFINRYQQGPQQISEQEAADRYRQVASQPPWRLRASGQGGLRPHVTRGAGAVREVPGPRGTTAGPRFHRPQPRRHRRQAARPRLPGPNDEPGTPGAAWFAEPALRRQW